MSAHLKNHTEAYKKINEIAVRPGVNFNLLSNEFLKLGIEFFDMELAIVSEVEEDNYFVYAVTDNTLEITDGMELPLGDTLCREVFEKRAVILHHNMSEVNYLANHPIYTEVGLKSYMGAPIWLGRKLFGTLNFSSLNIKKDGFSEEEKITITTMAVLLSKQLEIDLHGQTTSLIMKNIIHEIRSPLNGIIGSSDIMADTKLDQEQFELLDLIKRSSDSLETSVRDLSLYIKVNRDLTRTDVTPQYPIELTKEILKTINKFFTSKNIFFKHNESQCPQIQVFPSLYQASLRAILTECHERTRDRKEIEINYSSNERFFQVIINDNGPRLTEGVTKVINSFGRIEYSTNSFSTQGVNLNLILGTILMQLAGGHLRVRPIKKEDNQFVLSFPLN